MKPVWTSLLNKPDATKKLHAGVKGQTFRPRSGLSLNPFMQTSQFSTFCGRGLIKQASPHRLHAD